MSHWGSSQGLCLNELSSFIQDFMEITDTRTIYPKAFFRQNFQNRHFATRERARLKCAKTKGNGIRTKGSVLRDLWRYILND